MSGLNLVGDRHVVALEYTWSGGSWAQPSEKWPDWYATDAFQVLPKRKEEYP